MDMHFTRRQPKKTTGCNSKKYNLIAKLSFRDSPVSLLTCSCYVGQAKLVCSDLVEKQTALPSVLVVYQNREIRKGFNSCGDFKVDLVRRGTGFNSPIKLLQFWIGGPRKGRVLKRFLMRKMLVLRRKLFNNFMFLSSRARISWSKKEIIYVWS